jgi:uncharacterized membrane protein
MRSTVRLGGGLAFTALAVLASVLARPDLPAEMAMHFGPSGEPDDFASRTVGMALVPAIMLVLLAVLEIFPRVDPLEANIEAFERVYDVLVLALMAFLLGVHALLLAYNLGYDVPIELAVGVGIGALTAVIGFAFDHVERNWVVGVRNPWTLSDDTVWTETHDRAATTFKLAGALAAVAAVALPALELTAFAIPVGVALLVLAVVDATVYSYLRYRDRHPSGDRSTP